MITCAADESDISFYSRWERVVFVFPEMAGGFWVIFDGFSWDFVGYIYIYNIYIYISLYIMGFNGVLWRFLVCFDGISLRFDRIFDGISWAKLAEQNMPLGSKRFPVGNRPDSRWS